MDEQELPPVATPTPMSATLISSDTPIEAKTVDNGDGTSTVTIPVTVPKQNSELTKEEHIGELRKMERWFLNKLTYLEGQIGKDMSLAAEAVAHAIAQVEEAI